jgi:pyruvate dehydrogenase phosphatase
MCYSDLKKIDRGVRRYFHDDITVVVVFSDHSLISNFSSRGPTISIIGGGITVPSNSLALDNTNIDHDG